MFHGVSLASKFLWLAGCCWGACHWLELFCLTSSSLGGAQGAAGDSRDSHSRGQHCRSVRQSASGGLDSSHKGSLGG